MQEAQLNPIQLLRIIPFRHLAMAIAGLLLGSVTLAYFFQEIVYHYHCISKLGIILFGNLGFWAAANPIISTFTQKAAGNKYFMPASLGLGMMLLFINQALIQKAIFFIFLYGFGCSDDVTDPCYMLFENNILTAGLIYCMLSLVAYYRATEVQKTGAANSGAVTETNAMAPIEMPAFKSFLTIKNNGTTFKVNVQDIRYIEACKNTILIFTTDKKYVLYQSMVSLEKELDPECFVKIHRAFIVNKSFIRSFTGMGNGNQLVKLNCGAELVMTRHYRTQTCC